jgi:hypothetical protein
LQQRENRCGVRLTRGVEVPGREHPGGRANARASAAQKSVTGNWRSSRCLELTQKFGARNAGLLEERTLAAHHPELRERMRQFQYDLIQQDNEKGKRLLASVGSPSFGG